EAEDGIRDFHVTGVLTCALPISASACDTALRDAAGGGGRWRAVCRPVAVPLRRGRGGPRRAVPCPAAVGPGRRRAGGGGQGGLRRRPSSGRRAAPLPR